MGSNESNLHVGQLLSADRENVPVGSQAQDIMNPFPQNKNRTGYVYVTMSFALVALILTIRIDWPFGELLRAHAQDGSVGFHDDLFRLHAGVGKMASSFAGLALGSSIVDLIRHYSKWTRWAMFTLALAVTIVRFNR